jgi:hypothetical protein
VLGGMFDERQISLQSIRTCASFPTRPWRRHSPNPKIEARVLAMYAAYAQEVVDFLGHAPRLQSRPKPIRKEKDRDLFAAAG